MSVATSRSTSPAAKALQEQVTRRLQRSVALGVESHIRSELADLHIECSQPDWDGHDALAVTLDSYQLAERFLLALPLGTERPSIGAEPDGEITMEWCSGVRRCLSISFAPDGDLHYAALVGAASTCGTEPFIDAVPKRVLDLIKQVR